MLSFRSGLCLVWRTPDVSYLEEGCLLFKLFIDVWLIYNIVLVSTVQQKDSGIHIYTFF